MAPGSFRLPSLGPDRPKRRRVGGNWGSSLRQVTAFRSLRPGERAQTRQIPAVVTTGLIQTGWVVQAARRLRTLAVSPTTLKRNASRFQLRRTWHSGLRTATQRPQAWWIKIRTRLSLITPRIRSKTVLIGSRLCHALTCVAIQGVTLSLAPG